MIPSTKYGSVSSPDMLVLIGIKRDVGNPVLSFGEQPRAHFTDHRNMADLAHRDSYEISHPSTFSGRYHFWYRKCATAVKGADTQPPSGL